MPSAVQLESEVKRLISFMLKKGLVRNSRAPIRRDKGSSVSISFHGDNHLASVSKESSYAHVYLTSIDKGVYSFQMLDGALVQIQYEFRRRELLRHRLAFLPNPWLEPFMVRPSDYLDDVDDIDMAESAWPSAPLRFDFDSDAHKDVLHPRTHLTLGDRNECRIPVSHPLHPHAFIDFLLRSFYDTEANRFSDGLPQRAKIVFDETITDAESKLVHIAVPR